MKKILLGLSILSFGCGFLFSLGVLRHYIEEKINNGNSFSIFIPNPRYETKIDYSVLSTLIDGIHSLFTVALGLLIGTVITIICYKIGDSILTDNKVEK